MLSIIRICTVLAAALFLTSACASSPPQPDPLKEQITILQKQLLELQKEQNETRTKLDEAAATIDTLTVKNRAGQEKNAVQAKTDDTKAVKASSDQGKKKPAAKKKKPTKKKKKKKTRRQE